MSRQAELAQLGRVFDSGPLSNRNLIINGAMQVAQRGTSVSGVTSSGYYFVDRWTWIVSTDDTVTLSQSTDAPDGFGYSAKVEVTTADTSIGSTEFVQFRQNIEGQNLQQLAYGISSAKTMVLSFWVKSSLTGTYNVNLWQNAASKYYVETYTINSANTWEYKTIVIAGNTANTIANNAAKGIELSWFLSAGSSTTSGTLGEWRTGNGASGHAVDFVANNGATWQITGVQLEVGDTATPFEHRSYAQELALCQRYYQRFTGSGTFCENCTAGWAWSSTATSNHIVPLITEMRAAPTLQQSGLNLRSPTGGNFSATISIVDVAKTKTVQLGSSGSSGLSTNQAYWIAANSGYAAFDAEL